MASSRDLFGNLAQDMTDKSTARRTKVADASDNYTAADIEVLEGLEPVRRRPGMYIGGTDERALHHLIAEVLDNSMDEAVAGHADLDRGRACRRRLDDDPSTTAAASRSIRIRSFPKKSALEVILTTLHSGGKFANKAYSRRRAACTAWACRSSTRCPTSLRSRGRARTRQLFAHEIFARRAAGPSSRSWGQPTTGAAPPCASIPTRRSSASRCAFKPADRLHRMARAKAFLFKRRRDPLEVRSGPA